MHPDELGIDDGLVRRLLERDAPDLARLPLRRLAESGSSNALYRLGAEYLVRLPRQPGGSASLVSEARWLPSLAPWVPVAVPEIVVTGEPGFGYPERWAVTRWLHGHRAAVPTAGATGQLGADLAAFVAALGVIDVPPAAAADPALRWYRTASLAGVDDDIRGYLEACRSLPVRLDLDRCLALWTAAVSLPRWEGPDRWVHADLLAENLLVRDERLTAVIDFGGLAVGDPAVDLIVAWEVLDPPGRDRFRAAVGVDDATWLRGRAWALAVALMTFPYYWASMPGRCADRLVMARNVLGDVEAT